MLALGIPAPGPALLGLDEVGELDLDVGAAGVDPLDLLQERDALGGLALRGEGVRELEEHGGRLALAAGEHQRVRQLHAQAQVAAVALEELAEGLDGLRVLAARDQRVRVLRLRPASPGPWSSSPPPSR